MQYHFTIKLKHERYVSNIPIFVLNIQIIITSEKFSLFTPHFIKSIQSAELMQVKGEWAFHLRLFAPPATPQVRHTTRYDYYHS